jgi:hypothetical protein
MNPGLPKSLRRLVLAAVLTVLGAVAGMGGCSNSRCESSRCAAGNACLDDGSGSGETCHKVCTSQGECPYGYYCNDGQLGPQGQNWCVANTNYPPERSGQWDTPCLPSNGEGSNKACDWTDFFACYGTSPTDAMSFCTEYGCSQDSDCEGGWWCSTQNVGPNVVSADPTYGKTRTLCLPRWYCAPCKTDHDCSPAQDGTQQHCVADTQNRGYCTPQCATNVNCPLDATCVGQWPVCTPAQGDTCKSDDDCPPVGGVAAHCDGGKCTSECASSTACATGQTCQNLNVCVPRAGVCVGDGGFCSPCRSDVDCTDGYCWSGAPFSTERFCTTKSTVPCATAVAEVADAGATATLPGCPVPTASDNWKMVACTTGTPPNQCVATVTLGAKTSEVQNVAGCWTPNR